MTTGFNSDDEGARGFFGRILRKLQLFAENRLEDLLTMYGDIPRSLNSNPHLIATHVDHRDNNVVIDDDAFISLP